MVLCSTPFQTALVAAILNIHIPLELGQLVNTVARLEPGQELHVYLSKLVGPGMRLAGLYCAQVDTSVVRFRA